MKTTLPIEVKTFIRKEIHEEKLPDGFVEIDYGESDGGGSWAVTGVYHVKRKTLHHGNIETIGGYEKWTTEQILRELE